jgi:hypothetical protein
MPLHSVDTPDLHTPWKRGKRKELNRGSTHICDTAGGGREVSRDRNTPSFQLKPRINSPC